MHPLHHSAGRGLLVLGPNLAGVHVKGVCKNVRKYSGGMERGGTTICYRGRGGSYRLGKK